MVTAIDRLELRRLLDEEDALLVDVLPDSEYQNAHLPGAISLPLRRINSDSVAALGRSKPVVVY